MLRRGRLLILLCVVILGGSVACRKEKGEVEVPRGIVGEVWQIVDREFVDKTYNNQDWSQIGRELFAKGLATNEDARAAIRGMLLRLHEPGTRYLEPRQLASTIQELAGRSAGIGLADIWVRENGEQLEIVNVIARSPAFRAGLRSRDVIQRIDDVATANLSREEALMSVRGQPGTLVRLNVRRDGRVFDVTLRREILGRHSVHGSREIEQGKAVGYIALSQFADESPEQMRDVIRDLLKKGVAGFVLDLRNNPGGLVPACREIAGFFLDEKLLFYSIGRSGTKRDVNSIGPRLTDKPLVVLVNNASASASEILAGALQDYHRAVLVGSTTFGQGVVYSVRQLSDHSGLVIAVARLQTPDGREFESRGLKPDHTVENSEDFKPDQVATPEDRQYTRAVEVLLRRVK